MSIRHIFYAVAAMGFTLLKTACASSAPSTAHIAAVDGFDPDRYLGRWYEIARFPHSFEHGMNEVSAEYTKRPDGRIAVKNSGRRGERRKEAVGVAEFTKNPSVGELRVTFFRPFYGAYRIILLDEDYTLAAVTSDTMDYLWILSRTPQADTQLLDFYLEQLKKWKFPLDRLIWPEQPENVGK